MVYKVAETMYDTPSGIPEGPNRSAIFFVDHVRSYPRHLLDLALSAPGIFQVQRVPRCVPGTPYGERVSAGRACGFERVWDSGWGGGSWVGTRQTSPLLAGGLISGGHRSSLRTQSRRLGNERGSRELNAIRFFVVDRDFIREMRDALS